MTPSPAAEPPSPGVTQATAGEVWTLMSDLVLDEQRRRGVSAAVGLSFARIRAVRRLARRAMSMREFATIMDIDPPNATALVDDLESLGLAQRRPHPTDRRAKLVEATGKGKEVARKADEIMSVPPPGLAALSAAELQTLRQLLQRARNS